jgi:hypothetical protein
MLGKSSFHYSSKNIMACGMWLVSPRNMPQDDLSSHGMNMPHNTNNDQIVDFLIISMTHNKFHVLFIPLGLLLLILAY